MEPDLKEQIALHRWAVIAEATNDRLTQRERGVVVRQVAARTHAHPDGSQRHYSRSTIDRWIRAWRSHGLDGLRPEQRADTGAVRSHPELFSEAAALRLELPTRSAAQIASILYHRHGIRVSERTIRGQLQRRGLQREALEAEPKVFGRYEAERPNDRWITDVLVGPWVPFPKQDSSVRARLASSSTTTPGSWSTAGSSLTRTPVPARSCYVAPSHGGACQQSCTPTTGRRSRTPGCHEPVRSSVCALSTRSPTRLKVGASRNASTAIYERRSCPRRPITASRRSRS